MDFGPRGPAPHHCVILARVLALPNLISPAARPPWLGAASGPSSSSLARIGSGPWGLIVCVQMSAMGWG